VSTHLSTQTLGTAPTLGEWITETAILLGDAGVEGASRDARVLAAAGRGLSSAQILSEPNRVLTAQECARLDELRRRRMQREPISRILGRRGFMDLDLEISPATLDPRPDTETLVEAAIQVLREEGRVCAPLEILDLGTGTGAILIALLRALPGARGLGVDISAEALGVAERNIAAHGVAARARLHRGSWFEGVEGRFDLIVSNPPYIPTADIAGLAPEVVNYDPILALDGGCDGLMAYRMIAADSQRHLRPGGWLLLEIGACQEAAITALLDPSGMYAMVRKLRIFPDLTGRSRCVAIMQHAALSGAKK
jgi:release factor glutamine methyltransferase